MENEIKKAKEEIQVMSWKLQYIKIYSGLKPSPLYCMYSSTSNYKKKIQLVNNNGDKWDKSWQPDERLRSKTKKAFVFKILYSFFFKKNLKYR